MRVTPRYIADPNPFVFTIRRNGMSVPTGTCALLRTGLGIPTYRDNARRKALQRALFSRKRWPSPSCPEGWQRALEDVGLQFHQRGVVNLPLAIQCAPVLRRLPNGNWITCTPPRRSRAWRRFRGIISKRWPVIGSGRTAFASMIAGASASSERTATPIRSRSWTTTERKL